MAGQSKQIVFQWLSGGKAVGRKIKKRFGQAGLRRLICPADARRQISIQIEVPVGEICGTWQPYGGRATLQKVNWHGRLVGSPFFRPALLAFVGPDLENRLLLSTTPGTQEVEISWDLDQAKACYLVVVRWVGEVSKRRSAMWITTQASPVRLLIQQLIRQNSTPSKEKTPRQFYEPAYCTWYAFHADLSQDRVEACARLARQLGFGTFILDDGWHYDCRQRVGSALGKWHRFLGDYEPSKVKFPDFARHVSEVKATGLRYLLWVAPFIIGANSAAYRKLRKQLLESSFNEGFKIADPGSRVVVEHLQEKLTNLVERFAIDGFKVDYDYALTGPGETLLGLGPAYVQAVQRLAKVCKAIRPGFEYNLVPHGLVDRGANAFRCIDVPFDPYTNRMYMGHLKMLTGTLPLQSDPALWRPDDPVKLVHQHMVPALFCVPSIGAPILELGATHRKVIRDWLGFYRLHQQVLNHGRFSAQWHGGDYQNFRVSQKGTEIAAAFSRCPVKVKTGTRTVLINVAGEGSVVTHTVVSSSIRVEESSGRVISKRRRLPAGMQKIDCPIGGLIHFGY